MCALAPSEMRANLQRLLPLAIIGRLIQRDRAGGEAHDCPPAQRLIRRTKAAGKLARGQSL
jgi:hypothetical protein